MPLTSPYVWSSPDYVGNTITVTFTFDNITLALLTASSSRDDGCMYNNIYFGLGPDGSPNSTPKVFAGIIAGLGVQIVGTLLITYGFTTINDVLASQITAGP